ncbi:MAG: substrate-binding domain-containing protein [Anaerolineales bacterium]|nr:substrate-binding domain-containing protein [Anaerolineales bacterium]
MKTRFLIAIVIILILSGCALSASEPTPTPTRIPPAAPTRIPTLTTTVTPAPRFGCAPNCTYADMVVGLIQTGSEGGWRAANKASFRETAEDFGLTLKLYDSALPDTVRIQHDSIRQFIADEEVNVIVLAALTSSGWDEELREAKTAGKIVILTEHRIDVSEDLYVTYVGSNFVEEGRQAGRLMVALLESSKNRYIVELVGDTTSSAARDRGNGFREAIQGSGIEILQSEVANWTFAGGKQVMETMLEGNLEIQGLYAQNDDMALGAIEAIKSAGLQPGVDIKIVSIDATDQALEVMLASELNATVEYTPLIAPQVYETALMVLNGEVLPKWIPVHEGAFDWDHMPNCDALSRKSDYGDFYHCKRPAPSYEWASTPTSVP